MSDNDIEKTETETAEEPAPELEDISSPERTEPEFGAAFIKAFTPRETRTVEEIEKDIIQRSDKLAADRQAVKDETKAITDLNLLGLLTSVSSGMDPDRALRDHAKSRGMTLDAYEDSLRKYGIGFESMAQQVQSGVNAVDVLASAREFNPNLGSEEARVRYKKQEKDRDQILQEYTDRGEELPSWMVQDEFVWDEETSSFGGTDSSQLKNIAREGETAHMAATIRAQGLMSDPTVARYVRELEYKSFGGGSYYKKRIEDLRAKYEARDPDRYAALTPGEKTALAERLGKTVMAELATLKTVGIWTAPIFMNRDVLTKDSFGWGTEGTWASAFSPRIEIVGVHRRGRGATYVLRQAGSMDTIFRAVDSPGSAAIGALQYGGMEGAKRGVAEGAQAMDFAQDIADKNEWGTAGTASLLLAGTVFDVIRPGLEITPGLAAKAGKGVTKGARGVSAAGRFIKDVEPALLAYKDSNPELFAKLNLEISAKAGMEHIVDQVDAQQAALVDVMARANPDILDTNLADSLPGAAGELQLNLAPTYRKGRVKTTKEATGGPTKKDLDKQLKAGEIDEAQHARAVAAAERPSRVSPPWITRGKDSMIDDHAAQLKVIQAEKAKLKSVDPPKLSRQYAGVLNRKIVTPADAAQTAVGDINPAAATKFRDNILDTLPGALENPNKWYNDTIAFVGKELPGLERSAKRLEGETFATFVARVSDDIDAKELKEIKRRKAARDEVREQLSKIKAEASKFKKQLLTEAAEGEAQIARQIKLLDRAEAAVRTNMETRAAALYLVYGKMHGKVSMFKKPLGIRKMRKDILDKNLLEDLDEFQKLSAEAVFFAHGLLKVVLKGTEDRALARSQALMAARVMDARAKNWAIKNNRDPSEWWETRFGRIESKADGRKAVKKLKKPKKPKKPKKTKKPEEEVKKPKPEEDVDIEDVDIEDVDIEDDLDELDEAIEEADLKDDSDTPDLDSDKISDPPPYIEPPEPPTAGMPQPVKIRKSWVKFGSPNATLDAEYPELSAEALYNHLVQFDRRVNPDATTRDVAEWFLRHGKSPAARSMARKILPLLPDDGAFYIQNGSGKLGRGTLPFRGMEADTTGIAAWSGKWVSIKGSGYEYTGLTDQIVLHELLHHATNVAIKNPPTAAVRKAVDDLADFANTIVAEAKRVKKGIDAKAAKGQVLTREERQREWVCRTLMQKSVWGAKGDKALRATEVVAYGLTRPAIQQFLRSIEIKKVLKPGEKPRTLFSEFVTLISKLLNFGSKMPAQETNALHRAMLLSDDLIVAVKQADEIGSGKLLDEMLDLSPQAANLNGRLRAGIGDLSAALRKADIGTSPASRKVDTAVAETIAALEQVGVGADLDRAYEALNNFVNVVDDFDKSLGDFRQPSMSPQMRSVSEALKDLTDLTVDIEDLLESAPRGASRAAPPPGDVAARATRAAAPEAPVEGYDPFYSALERSAEALPDKIGVSEILPLIKKQDLPGVGRVKQEEIKYTLMEEFVEDLLAEGVKSISKDDLLAYIGKNRVTVEETAPGGVSKERRPAQKQKDDAFKGVEESLRDMGYTDQNLHVLAAKRSSWAADDVLSNALGFKQAAKNLNTKLYSLDVSYEFVLDTSLTRIDAGPVSRVTASTIAKLIDDIGETELRAITGDEFVDALKADRREGDIIGIDPWREYEGPESALNITIEAKQELSDLLRQKRTFLKRARELLDTRVYGSYHRADDLEESIQRTIEDIKTALQRKSSTRYHLEQSGILDDAFFNFDVSAGADRLEKRRAFLASPEWRAVEEADERLVSVIEREGYQEVPGPHYPSYVSGNVPGLEGTYREILIQKPLPLERPRTAAEKRIDEELKALIAQYEKEDIDSFFFHAVSDIEVKYPDYTPPPELDELAPDHEPYKSHNWQFGDVEYDDVVVHIRTRDIKDAEGNKVLFVEEIQSDWHQEGRVQGYSAEENRALREKFDNQMRALDEEAKKITDNWTYSFVEKTVGTPPVKKVFVEIGVTDLQNVSISAELLPDYVIADGRVSYGQRYRVGSPEVSAQRAVYNLFVGQHPSARLRKGVFFQALKEAGVDPAVLQIPDRAQSLAKKQQQVVQGPLPDAPFKKTWPNVAVKRLLHLAAEEGYSSIAFTKGDVIHELVGGGLSGQEYFYNKVLPKVISKEAKKVNATVEVVSSPIGGKALTGGFDFGTTKNADIARSLEAGVVTIKLSPESKKIAEKGRPLFAKREVEGVEELVSETEFLDDGRAVIRILSDNADFSSVMNEIGFILRKDMDPDELDEIVTWLRGEPHNLDVEVKGTNIVYKGTDTIAKEADEIFAQSFEKYIRNNVSEGRGVDRVFEMAKHFMARIYASLRADPSLVVAPRVKTVLDRMLAETPSEGVLKDSIKAARHNLKGTRVARGAKESFHEFKRALKDQPIGVNAELGSVSAGDRIGESLRRVLKADQKGLSDEQIHKKIEELVAQVQRGEKTADQAVLSLPTPIMHHRYPGGKDEFTLQEIISLQSRLESERAEVLTTVAPDLYLKGRQEVIEEMTPVEQLRNMMEGSSMKQALGRGWLFTMFGGDSAYAGKASLRKFPTHLRSSLLSAGAVIEEAYGNAIRLIHEKDLDKLNDFLTGKAVSFTFGGRAALASGWNSFNSVSDQIHRVMADISVTVDVATRGTTKFSNDRLIETLNQVFKATKPNSGKAFLGKKQVRVPSELTASAAVVDEFIEKFFGKLDPSNSSSFTKDVGQAIGITPKWQSQQYTFAEALLYYTGVTKREDALVHTRNLSDKERVGKLLDEIELAFGGGEKGKQVRGRVAVLMAGHGQTERAIQDLYGKGLVFEQRDWDSYLKWSNGEKLTPKEMIGAQKIARKAGLNPGLVEEPLLEAGMMLPKVTRERLGEALARGQVRLGTKTPAGTVLTASEQDISGAMGAGIRYMKLRMTRGAVALRQRYFLMNTVDHFSQMAMITGFRRALVSTIRVAAQDVMVLPGIARTFALVDKGSPGAMEKVRQVLQKGGDVTARAVGKLLGVSKYRADLNAILEGREGVVRLGNRVYSNREVRDIMVQEGIFASFNTRELADVIRRSGKEGFVARHAKGAPDLLKNAGRTFDDVVFKTVSDTAEAWGDRERAGAVLTLMESGLSPRAASRLTIDALYDYAGSMSKADRSWIVSLFFPFWAFQKNANTQVFNLLFSPGGAYRMNCVRRATTDIPEFFTQLVHMKLSEDPDLKVPTPYGLYLADMTTSQRQMYELIVDRLENGYGPIESMSEETKAVVLSSYGRDSFEQLTEQQRQIIQYGFGPAYMMPEETRAAVTALFANTRHSRVVDGELLEITEQATLLAQTGLLRKGRALKDIDRSALDAALSGYVDEETGEQVAGLKTFAFPDMGEAGQRSYLLSRGRLPIPPVFNKNTRAFYDKMTDFGFETPYLEWVLPDSTINAGFRHMANINAAYILTAYKAGKMLVDPAEGELRDPSGVDTGISPLTPLEQVLDIASTPIPGVILEALTEPRMGYPRRIHPVVADGLETFIPGMSILRIDGKKMQEARSVVDKYGGRYEDLDDDEKAALVSALKELDPWEDAEALTFATDAEYQEYLESSTRTLISERAYLPPGPVRFLFENSPFGELNKILMSLPTKVPLAEDRFLSEKVDYRSKYEQVQDPEQLLQWARFLLGVDIQEVSPEKTARIEERKIPRELQ